MPSFDFHPLSNIFPLIEGQAFSDLVADVIKHGVREPVWLYEGQILDGRNRWRAANVAGVECLTRTYEGDEPAAFVVSLNLHRRDLNVSQRAAAAARLHKVLTERAQQARSAKAGWIAAARASFDPGKRLPCAVCGRYQSVTHAHHLRPLHMQSHEHEPDQRFVWLCPSHHAGVHLLLAQQWSWPSLEGFDDSEKGAMEVIAAKGVLHAS